MRENNIPNEVNDVLSNGESIIAIFEFKRFLGPKIKWFATTKRVMKYVKRIGSLKLAEIPYRQITSVTLKTGVNWLIIILGVLFSLTVIGVFVGIPLIIIGILKKISYYQITGAGIDIKEWKVVYGKSSKEIRNLIDEIRRHLP